MASSMEVDFSNANGPNSPGIAFDVEIEESSGSTVLVPKRVIKRLQRATENKSKSPASLEEIKVRLKEADERRQRFHEWLANKARAKQKSSPPASLSPPDDQAEKLAAKLSAAEQKRLDLLTQEQMRLAKLHELRVAAKTEAQLRAEREREALGSKVEYRVQQAESNRLAILEAEKQRRAITHERVAQYLLQRMFLEGKDRERAEALRAAICQKISAAEEKRACILEAEKSRAKAIVLQARRVAKAVLKEREQELRKKKENLEARLSRAKRQRAAYLQQRGGCRGACHNHGHKMSKHGDHLCRKLTRYWRQFRRSRRTTYALAEDFAACSINKLSLSSLPFDQLASRITSPGTLRTVKVLLARIESRLLLSSSRQNDVGNVDHLLKRLSPVHRKTGNTGRTSRRSCKVGPLDAGKIPAKGKDGQVVENREFERYPARIFLCAYMIVEHPDAVFSSQGDREVALAEAAAKLLPEFETLVSIILNGPSRCPSPTSAIEELPTDQLATPPPPSCQKRPFSSQLIAFDNAWCSYLYHFVVWKIKDAQLLEEDLIRMACQLEVSMLQKCKMNAGDDSSTLSHDFQVIQRQVLEDQKLLHDRILRLTGQAGVLKMEEALSTVRAEYDEAKQSGASLPSPFAYSTSAALSPQSVEEQQQIGHRPKVVRSLFTSSTPTPLSSSENSSLESSIVPTESLVNTSEDLNKTDLTNEQIVNEMLHNPTWKFTEKNSHQILQEGGIFSKENQKKPIINIQAQIKSTMERAFWDSVSECLVKDPPDYDRIVGLVKEIRDDLASLSPGDWKKELMECLDLDILSQVLYSGSQDFEYLRHLLDYTLNVIVKLGAPVRDEDSKLAHQQLVESLSNAAISTDASLDSSFKSALVEGLRFIFGQLQILKQDINDVRLRALASLVTGSAGVEYMQKAFAKCYGLPLKPPTSTLGSTRIVSQKLPRTAKWIIDTKVTLEQAKMEMEASLLAVRGSNAGSLSPAAASLPLSMCTGGRTIKVYPEKVVRSSSTAAEEDFVMAPWDSMHTVIRLGLLQIACSPEAVVEETLPETLVLNAKRLKVAQNAFQHIVVLITGLLLIRQELAKLNVSGPRLESALEKGFSQLDSLLGRPAVTIPDIGSLLARVCSMDGESSSEVVLREELMTRVLEKSLKPSEDIFQRVSGALRVSVRGMLTLGNGKEGCEVAESALSRVGGCSLIGHVSKLVTTLQTVSSVSWKVHGAWYMLLDAAEIA